MNKKDKEKIKRYYELKDLARCMKTKCESCYRKDKCCIEERKESKL